MEEPTTTIPASDVEPTTTTSTTTIPASEPMEEPSLPPTPATPKIQPMSMTSSISVSTSIPSIQITPAIVKTPISITLVKSPQSDDKKEVTIDVSDNASDAAPAPSTTTSDVADVTPVPVSVSEVADIVLPVDDVTPVPPKKVSETLMVKLQAMMSVKVNPAILTLISTLEHEPMFFDTELVNILGEIVKDGVINSADIPQLLVLVERLITLLSAHSPIKIVDLGELCLDVVHLVLTVVLEEKLVPGLSPATVAVIESVLKSCVAMSGHIYIHKPKRGWLALCKSCF
jgi:hypothetical protein